MAGKGDKLRKGANLNLYWQNYDSIFNKGKSWTATKCICGGEMYYDLNEDTIKCDKCKNIQKK